MNASDIARVLAPLHRRVMLAIGRATLRSTSAGGGVQRISATLTADEQRGEIEHLQPYGLASRARAGAEALIVCVGGDRGHPVCVVADDPRGRPSDLADGEVCVYGPRPGQRVWLRADGSVQVEATTILLKPSVKVRVEGDVEVTGDVVAGTVSLRTHRHGGVAAGGALSGVPA